ncbi:MAG TPA: SigB/SigF/SigG family RNA polymerase sigma factor, partial [Streptosporangiaceae bacterium]|nr:SigB/SigF/SigG family RNA polymerase sigma factor [Streptosporangiaceae bacterium]
HRETEHRDTQDRDTGQLLSQLRGMPADDQRYEELRAQIVARHVGLARSIARRYANRGEPAEDLEQAALVGLVKAINGFDPLRGHDFIAYARPMMNGEIKRHFRDLTWAVRVPRKYQEGRLELSQAVAALTQRLRRPPTTTELAAELRLSMDDLTSLMAAAGAYSALSLSLPDGPDDQRTLGDSLGAMDEELAAVEDRESLQPLLDALPPRELRLLLLRFFGNQTQAEIAAELGVSQMQVSRLLATTLARLRKSMLT